METSFDFTPPLQIGRGRKKATSERTPEENNLRQHVDKMNNQQQEQAIEAITENLTAITTVDNNGKENQNQNNQHQIKTEFTEIPNTNKTNNKGLPIKKSSRIRSNNHLVRFGNPITR